MQEAKIYKAELLETRAQITALLERQHMLQAGHGAGYVGRDDEVEVMEHEEHTVTNAMDCRRRTPQIMQRSKRSSSVPRDLPVCFHGHFFSRFRIVP